MSPLIELDDSTPHDMTEDDLYDHLRYFLNLQGRPQADESKVPGSKVLLDVEPADLDRLCAGLWVVASMSSGARREVAETLFSGLAPFPTPLPCPDCKTTSNTSRRALTGPGSDEDLDHWVREVYSCCPKMDVVRDCIQILLIDVASRGESTDSRELLRITCPDLNDVMSGRPVVSHVPPWRLATAQEMVLRSVKVKAFMNRLDGI